MQITYPSHSTVWSSRMGLCCHEQCEEAASHSEQNYAKYLWRGQMYLQYTSPHSARRQILKWRDWKSIGQHDNLIIAALGNYDMYMHYSYASAVKMSALHGGDCNCNLPWPRCHLTSIAYTVQVGTVKLKFRIRWVSGLRPSSDILKEHTFIGTL
jgi:hypothetical protein